MTRYYINNQTSARLLVLPPRGEHRPVLFALEIREAGGPYGMVSAELNRRDLLHLATMFKEKAEELE